MDLLLSDPNYSVLQSTLRVWHDDNLLASSLLAALKLVKENHRGWVRTSNALRKILIDAINDRRIPQQRQAWNAMYELIDQLPTVYDVRQVLRVWHQPTRLANTHIGQSRLVRSRVQTGEVASEAVEADSALASATRDVLLEAMRQLRQVRERAPSLEPLVSLAYGKYVLQKRIMDICSEESISPATCSRYITNELEELSIILARMIAALPQTESRSETWPVKQTVFSVIPVPPPIFAGRNSQLQEACALLLSEDSGTVVAFTGQPGSGKSALAAKVADDVDILRRYLDGIVWLDIGPHRDLRSCLGQLMVDLNLDEEGSKPERIP